MIDYRKYIKVLEILKRTESISGNGFVEEDTIEKKASAICDLFDTQKITTSGFVMPLQEQLQNAPKQSQVPYTPDLNIATGIIT